MKKISVLLLCLVCLAAPSVAKNNHPRKKTAKQPAANATQQPQQLDFFQKHLRDRVEREQAAQQNEIPVLSWKQFKEKAKKAVLREKTLNSTRLSFYKRAQFAKNMQMGQPQWAGLVANEKFLFLGEPISGAAATFEAAKAAVSAIRRKFPGQSILLATDFVQTPVVGAEPLRKPGQQTNLVSRYPLFRFADQQNIDILAMDDHIFTVKDGEPLVKVGEEYVQIYTSAEEERQAFADTINRKSDEKLDFLLSLEEILKHSLYGVNKLNQQWAKRIEAVADQYDFVIVYTSADHIATEGSSLANHLQQRTAPAVILVPAIGQIPESKREGQLALVSALQEIQFSNEQLAAMAKGMESKNSYTQMLYYLRGLSFQAEEDDLFISADDFRSFHARIAADPSGTFREVIGAHDALEVFTNPFWVELFPSALIAQESVKDCVDPADQQVMESYLAPIYCETDRTQLWEHSFLYYVGEAPAGEYVPQEEMGF